MVNFFTAHRKNHLIFEPNFAREDATFPALSELKKISPPEIPLRFEEAYLGQVSTQKFQV